MIVLFEIEHRHLTCMGEPILGESGDQGWQGNVIIDGIVHQVGPLDTKKQLSLSMHQYAWSKGASLGDIRNAWILALIIED